MLGAAPVARGTEPAGGDRFVQYQNDRLTVHLEHVPLIEVFQELARITGATVRGDVMETREASVEFYDVPLSEGLHRLLGNQNFTLVYDANGQLRTVRLLGGPQAVIAKPGAVVPGTAAGLTALFRNHAPLSVSGRLAAVVGGPTATFEQLGKTAVQHDDEAVRAEALGAILTAVEAEPELKTAVINMVVGMDDGTLGATARGFAGDRASELLSGIAARTRVPQVRVRANKALQGLTSAKR